jgi:hypothetical protein
MKNFLFARMTSMLLSVALFSIVVILFYFKQIVFAFLIIFVLIVFMLILSVLIMTGKYQTVLSPFWKKVLVFGYIENKYPKIWGAFLFILGFIKIGFDVLLYH